MIIIKRKKKNGMVYITIGFVVLLGLVAVGCINRPKFGRSPQGERLKRVEQSPYYRDGKFQNMEVTPQLTSEKSRTRALFDFIFEKRERNRPTKPIPTVKSDIKTIDPDQEVLVWFGHSSYYLQSAGKRMLIDPVFEEASPVAFFNKSFEGTDIYQADDLPNIDYLIITHDHWDHLDYKTVTALRPRVQYVVCPLGVGEHFEYWGYAPEQIIEMDWDEHHLADNNLTIHCLPARHFSGRTFRSNQAFWASYMIETSRRTIYLSGDGGYGIHFKQIADRFPQIDWAIMENGQYSRDWRHIHLMPEDLNKAIEELRPRRVMAGHNSKYALAKHPWDEPLKHADTIPSSVMPKIGEVVFLSDSTATSTRWWNLIE